MSPQGDALGRYVPQARFGDASSLHTPADMLASVSSRSMIVCKTDSRFPTSLAFPPGGVQCTPPSQVEVALYWSLDPEGKLSGVSSVGSTEGDRLTFIASCDESQ